MVSESQHIASCQFCKIAMVSKANVLNLQARGDEMVWLKRQQQADTGHTALVGLMDALLHLQQGDMLHVPGSGPGFDMCTATLWCCCNQMPTSGLDQLLLWYAGGTIGCTPPSYMSACLAYLAKGHGMFWVHVHRLDTRQPALTDLWGECAVDAPLLRIIQAWPVTLM